MVKVRKLVLSSFAVCFMSYSAMASVRMDVPSHSAVKILSIQGSGMRVLIALRILRQIESLAGMHSYEFFDVISGDGFGGVVALALAQGKSASELIQLFESNASTAFKRSKMGRIKGPKYSSVSYEDFLRILYGENSLSDLRGQVLVSARTGDRTHIFSNMKNVGGYSPETSLISVARATTSDKSYFHPIEIEGQVFANSAKDEVSPILRAVAAVRGVHPDSEVFALSIDSGQLEGRDRPLTETEAGTDLMLNVGSSNSAYYRIRSSFRNPALKPSDVSKDALLSYQYAAADTLEYFGTRLVEVVNSMSRDVRAPDHASAMIYAMSKHHIGMNSMEHVFSEVAPLAVSLTGADMIPSPVQRGISTSPYYTPKRNRSNRAFHDEDLIASGGSETRIPYWTPRSGTLGVARSRAILRSGLSMETESDSGDLSH